MSDLYHHRTQLPVGEGFFHAGCVWANHKKDETLSYVYDCGAQSTYQAVLAGQIEKYAETRLGPCADFTLDLLFLSHAHVDHVNGVPQLMGWFSVGTVVMPLIEPIQRLMAFAHATYCGAVDENPDGFYGAFIVDPAAAVRELGADRVIEVTPAGQGGGGGRGRGGTGSVEGSTTEPGSDAPDDVPFEDTEVAVLPLAEGATQPQSWELVGPGNVQVEVVEGDARVLRIPDTMFFRATTAPSRFPWVLVTHVDPPVRRRAAEFRAALQQKLGVNRQQLDTLFADPKQMEHLVTNLRKELVASYVQACQRKDLNITSLSLYSGPDPVHQNRRAHVHVASDFEWQGDRYHYTRLPTPKDESRVGWLGTGDAALKQDVRRKPFLEHFEPYANCICTMTLPHHGSANSYHPDLVTEIAPKICVAPAAPYSTWQHPGPSVVASAAQYALVLPVSNEPASRLNERFHICVH